MLVFTSPALSNGGLEFSLARKHPNKYLAVYARAYGMAATREWSILNFTTPGSERLFSSPQNRPCIWLDTELDRDERNLGPAGGMLAAMLAAEPPVVKATGRTKMIHAALGGEREAHEIEILVQEDDLARFCYYCGGLQHTTDIFERCGGEGYTSIYWCPEVSMY